MTRRRLATLVALLLLLAFAALAIHRGHRESTAGPRIGAPGQPLAHETRGGDASPLATPSASEQALARAYAALGAASDGDDHLLTALDPEARAQLDEARRLLDDSPPRLVTAVPNAAASGAATGAPPAISTGAASAAGTARPGVTGAAPDAAAAPSDGRMTLDLSHMVDPRTALRDTPDGPELLEPGLWAKIPFRPQVHPRVVVTDRSGGGYALAFYGSDFSTIRLDGGLVVPGRFYHVNGQSVITGAVPFSVDIRPLNVVGQVAEQPAKPPTGKG